MVDDTNNIVVRNAKQSNKVDGSDATKILPSDWNTDLVVILSGLLKALDVLAPSIGSILRVSGTQAVEQLIFTDLAAALAAADNAVAARGVIGAAALDSPQFVGTPAAPTVVASDTSTRIATMAAVHAVLSSLNAAPLASPAFTGIPTAPTAALGTNTTQLATMAAVKAAIDALLAGAPGALDTLNELSAALGNDANYAATLTSALALKAALASPTFTGIPAAPTAAPGTNTTQIATMAALQAGLATAGDTFGSKLLHVRDEKTSGTNGGVPTAGVWNTRDLNTVKTNQISGASLLSNQITLPAGTYFCLATCPAYRSAQAKARLQNITAGTTLLLGSSEYTDTSNSVTTQHPVKGVFTLAGATVIQLQHYHAVSNSGGIPTSIASIAEVYSEIMLWKVA